MVTKLRTYAKVAEAAEHLLDILMDSKDKEVILACLVLKKALANLR